LQQWLGFWRWKVGWCDAAFCVVCEIEQYQLITLAEFAR
jgi:hypothetical protein